MSVFEQKNENLFKTHPEQWDDVQAYCEGYKNFINRGKIERFCVEEGIRLAEAAGFVPFEYGKSYRAGDKIYLNRANKAAAFAVIGSSDLRNGFNIGVAHVDCPKLDLKLHPFYEASELALAKTHYYGGIKKYQWVALPLSLVGVVCLKDGSTVRVDIGSDDADPVFYISDLLPHLAKDQKEIEGEQLNVLFGCRPVDDAEEKSPYKAFVLKLLNEKYGLTEADFESADLSVVPVEKARDVGLDRGLISAYGHDDRVDAYPCLTALLSLTEIPEKTCVAVFADREEIGSEGITGMNSTFLFDFLTELAGIQNVREAFANSCALSADVSAAFDPTFASAYEKNNSAFLNHGVSVCKFTGSRGKSGSSEATAELIAKIRRIFDENGVAYQFCELGKVDQGGGGTVAKYIAQHNIPVIDIGVALLSMHAPYEIAAKYDIYHTHLALSAFYKNY